MQTSLWIAVREALIAVRHRLALCLTLTAAVVALVVCAWIAAPRTYVSEAKLFVRVGRETVTLDPTATTGQTISVYEARETELNSVLDVMASRAVREMVVDRMGTAVVLGQAPVPPDDPNESPIAVNPERDNGQAFISSLFPSEFHQYTHKGKKSARGARSTPTPRSTSIARPAAPKKAQPAAPQQSENAQAPEADGQIPVAVAALTDTEIREREQAILSLAKQVRINAGKKSGVITLEARAASPELAQRILRTTLDCFLVQHLRINRTHGSYRFFLDQVELTRKDLEGSTNLLRDAKNRLGVVSIEGHRKLIQDQMAQYETSRLDAETSLAATTATVTELKRALADFPATLVSQEVTGSPNDSTDRARQQLQDLEIRERDLTTKFTGQHPAVMAVREQAAQARSILEERRTAGGSQRTQAINPAAQQMQLRLAEESAKVAAQEARVHALKDRGASLRTDLESLNANEAEILQLEKKVELAQASLKTHNEKLEQARIDQALEDGRISNVNIVQQASYSPTPASPSSKLVFLLGGVLALGTGFGAPFGWEFGRRAKPILLAALAQPPGQMAA